MLLYEDNEVLSHTTQDPPVDGSQIWFIARCASGCPEEYYNDTAYVAFDFSGIPAYQVIAKDMTCEFSFLVCSPQPTFETREVRNNGQGLLTIQSDDGSKVLAQQGNLHATQTTFLLSAALNGLQVDSGPAFGIDGLGTQTQVSMFFGNAAMLAANTTTGLTTFKPLPLSNITAAYSQLVQSATRIFMSGALATAYVPGRVTREVLVFGVSMPNVIASTVLFAVLSILVIAARFRPRKEPFTLFSVAAALDESGIPAQFADLRRDQVDLNRSWSRNKEEEELITQWRGRVVSVSRSTDGSIRLHLE